MQITFNSYEEMMEFMGKINGDAQNAEEPKAVGNTAPVQSAAPVAQPVQSTPAAQPVQTAVPTTQAAPVQAPVTPMTPVAQPVSATQTVQTSTAPVAPQREYTQDEIAAAAMQLMDRGGQAQLQSLLAGYGVESLPQLPKEQYGNFATALRGMGAQI